MTIFSNRILALDRFDEALRLIAVRSTVSELGDLSLPEGHQLPEWNFALTCASALTHVDEELAQDAVLRVAQGCLRDESTNDAQKAAAVLLLRRVGNELAVTLAADRDLTPSTEVVAPPALELDAALRSSELRVTVPDGQVIEVNPFQKKFWDLAERNDWVSISAPTSAGKSHIIREWIVEFMRGTDPVRVVYLAPTRALVEEVAASLRLRLGARVGVHTLPWDPEIGAYERQVFVLTQERLHLLHFRFPDFDAGLVFIDEAQKISEGTRGILMSQVIDESLLRNPDVKLIFASPLSANPEVLVSGGRENRTAESLVGETVTVNQSLVFVRQVYRKPREYAFSLQYRGSEAMLGTLELPRAPGGVGKRLPAIAAAVGRHLGGNLVYANGPSDAEKYASQIFHELGEDASIEDERIDDLIAFAEGVVHQRFLLGSVARRGVAFHYGDMPLVLKAKVEKLFKEGVIKFLVCTSTLLEGVNLPCRNIFVRGPKKGSDDMSLPDFWNLAGRAGRWGQEFQGNIICIDATDESVWPNRPGARERAPIRPAAVDVFASPEDVVSYIDAGGPKSTNADTARLESAFSWIMGHFFADDALDDPFGLSLGDGDRDSLREALVRSQRTLEVDSQILKKHAGISPQSIQRLFNAVVSDEDPSLIALVPPSSDDAMDEYKSALDLVAEFLGGSFEPERRRYSLARLIVQWMRGVPLSVMIDNRARWIRQQGDEVSYPKLIRRVMKDVESIARFEAPKYLSCFSDVVAEAAREIGQSIPDSVEIDMMLELGVPRVTDMSFIALGLSRATVIAISKDVPEDRWSPSDCGAWIDSQDPEDLDVPNFAIRELREVRNERSARENFGS
jgi:hypothetical protein